MRIDLISGTAVCNFLNQHEDNMKSCSIVYNHSETCGIKVLDLSSVMQSAENISNTVIVGLPFLKHLNGNDGMYCFVATASNGTYTVMVQGKFSSGKYS